MKIRRTLAMATFATALSAAAMTNASAAGHYVAGVEGLDAGSAPPPGLYYLGYLVDYQIDSVSGAPGENKGNISAYVNRLTWITHKTILGAAYGMEAVVPLQSTSLTFNGLGVSSTSRGVGDIYLAPLILAWHGMQYDLTFSAGEWMPTGSYSSTNPSSIGLGYHGTMLTLGETIYLGASKAWSASALMRYEMNGSQQDTGLTPGNELSLEWGIGHPIGGGQQIGLVGYLQNQTTGSTGPGSSPLDPRKAAIGIEYDLPLAHEGPFLKIAAYREISASGGAPKGNLLRMTFVEAF